MIGTLSLCSAQQLTVDLQSALKREDEAETEKAVLQADLATGRKEWMVRVSVYKEGQSGRWRVGQQSRLPGWLQREKMDENSRAVPKARVPLVIKEVYSRGRRRQWRRRWRE